MQQNQNNSFKNIASLKTIPEGEVFDAENVWNKLENKINKKKKRKALWIWVAASMLILISVSTFFKLHYSNKKDEQIVGSNKQNNSQKIAIAKKNYKVNVVVLKPKNSNIKVLQNKMLITDTLNTATKTTEIITVDSTPLVNEEQKNVANISISKPTKKRLKIVYASDFVEENDIAKVKQPEKISIAKGLFKVFETPANKELEENAPLEHNQQPSKTLLFFKAKPTTKISLTENQ